MTGRNYETARIADLERPDGWSPIRRELEVQSFGVNAWTAHEAGATLIAEHDERPSRHEELYLVVAGRATFTVGGEQLDAPAGTIVFVRDPATTRGAVTAEADTTVLAVGAEPGKAYRPRPWEANVDILPLFASGQHAEAKRLLLEALDRYEERNTLLYNLACAEAQLGETEAAFDHLAAALPGRADLAELARGDDDLAPLRDDPRFAVGRRLTVEPHQAVREAFLLDVAHVPEPGLLEGAPGAAVRLLDSRDARPDLGDRQRPRGARTRRARAARGLGRSAPPRRSAGRRRQRPVRPGRSAPTPDSRTRDRPGSSRRAGRRARSDTASSARCPRSRPGNPRAALDRLAPPEADVLAPEPFAT